MSIEDDAWKAATAGMAFSFPEERLRGAFVRRRAKTLIKRHGNWNATKLATQLEAELVAVASYLQTKDPLIKGTDTTLPAHLNLRDSANALSGMGSSAQAFIDEGEKRYRFNRTQWVGQIVWRAVALHPDVWASEGPPPTLAIAALDEILDRRLRVAEQMTCNVNAVHGVQIQTMQRTWTIAGPNGPWKDGFVVRNFEYPVLPLSQFATHLPQMPEWKEAFGTVIVFTPPAGQAPIFFPKEIRAAWLVKVTPAGTMWVTYKPSASRKPADVIGRMFGPPRAAFHERCWLFCDMVASSLGIEAAWLGNHRRHGDDTDFDAVANKPDYMVLGPVVQFDRTHDLDVLMCDDQDPFFESVELEVDDLQVGDFVCFWSSRIYDLIVPGGAWRNEFSYVMRVDVDGKTGKVRVLADGPQVWLAGHGIDTVLYAGMATNLVDWIDKALTLVRVALRTQLFVDPNLKETTTAMSQRLVLWSPYEAFDPPGAWWLVIPRQVWHNEWDFATVAEVLKAVPRTVAKESGGTGYNPPEADVIYFPLYEPIVAQTAADGDSWRAYLRQRKADASFRVSTSLDALKVDGRMAGGLFYRGSKTKIPVARPRPRP